VKVVSAFDRDPVEMKGDEQSLIAQVDRFLRAQGMTSVTMVGPGGEEVTLAAPLLRVLRQAAHALAQDEAVMVVPVDRQLTTNQAADILNVSRQYLVRLLKRGEIPCTMVGSHRRVDFGDLMAYKRVRATNREAALDELAQMSQDLGFYEED
jgi:excisionase family DNA binding protein